MSTRFVRTVCCDVPVVLSDPNTQALTARAIAYESRLRPVVPFVSVITT